MPSNDSDAPIFASDELEDLALVGEFDAQVWARRFVQVAREIPALATDQDTMVAWFAAAIMAGYDKGTWDASEKRANALPGNEREC
jgi:hypothetical protein